VKRAAEPLLPLSAPPGDEVKTTTCYMCACRCGIKVHLQDGRVRYIEGNRDHPVNHGVLCGKGAAGIMQHNAPSRLRKPLRRIGPRGSGQFAEISWEEALALATEKLATSRARDPARLAFFTGRDQSQSLTGWFAQQYGTPNYAAHGGFCSVNMAAAGLYTFGGSFWEFGEPDWEHTRYFMLFGVAEDHSSNPLKIGLGQLKARGVKVVAINPVRSGYGAIADEWIGIRPGTDGLFVGALIHTLLRQQQVDLDYLRRYSNAPWLVIQDAGAADDGLFARDDEGRPLVHDCDHDHLSAADTPGINTSLGGCHTLADGRQAVPAFSLIARQFLAEQYAPEAVAATTGVAAATIHRIAAELAEAAFGQSLSLDIPWTDSSGQQHRTTTGRPVAMHAMRGISAHANGFQTCRSIHLLQILLGTIDSPGGFLYKPPCPKNPADLEPPAGRTGSAADQPLNSPVLGYPQGPEDLLVDAAGKAQRIDQAYSWDAPLAIHGLLHMVIGNAAAAPAGTLDVLFLYMANMSWNSAMNVPDTIAGLTATDPASGDYRIPFIIYSDAYWSEMVAYADLVLPDTTYLERWDCISLLDRPISTPAGPADAIRQPVVKPDRDVRPFQDVLLDLGARLGLPGFVTASGAPAWPGGYPDYMVNHQRKQGIGPLAGWRGRDGGSYGRGEPNPDQLAAYIANGCFHQQPLAPGQRYYRHANQAWLEWAKDKGLAASTKPVVFQLYLESLQRFRLAAAGHGDSQPPASHRERITTCFNPVPCWYPVATPGDDDYPFSAVTQRPMHMYHSWGSHNGWLRQITASNALFMHPAAAAVLDLADGDAVWVSSAKGRVRATLKLMDGVNPDTVWTWNAIGRRAGAAGLSAAAPEVGHSFLFNQLISEWLPANADSTLFLNSDPITGQAAWYDLRVRIEKAGAQSMTEKPDASLHPQITAAEGTQQ